MFGSYDEAIKILEKLLKKEASQEGRKVLQDAIAVLRDAWVDEEKAFAQFYGVEIPAAKEVN